METTVQGYRIREKFAKDIRKLFYPSRYTPETELWKRKFIKEHLDRTTPGSYIDVEGRSTPIQDATVDHQPRVVEHWNSEGKQTSQRNRAEWFTDPKKGHLTVIARRFNSSDGAEARRSGLRYSPNEIGKDFRGQDE